MNPEITTWNSAADRPLLPVYSDCKPLKDADFQGDKGMIKAALNVLEKGPASRELLPDWLVERHGLLSWQDALRGLHRPSSMHEHKQARRRLAFQARQSTHPPTPHPVRVHCETETTLHPPARVHACERDEGAAGCLCRRRGGSAAPCTRPRRTAAGRQGQGTRQPRRRPVVVSCLFTCSCAQEALLVQLGAFLEREKLTAPASEPGASPGRRSQTGARHGLPAPSRLLRSGRVAALLFGRGRDAAVSVLRVRL